MITFRSLYQSARLRSLPLSMSGIILGSAIAYSQGYFQWDIFLWALLTTILFQVLSDYANEMLKKEQIMNDVWGLKELYNREL